MSARKCRTLIAIAPWVPRLGWRLAPGAGSAAAPEEAIGIRFEHNRGSLDCYVPSPEAVLAIAIGDRAC